MRVIAGTARRLNLVTVPGMDTRPTTDKYKETLFNILQTRVGGSYFLDLFAGSGAIGIEALSRGARQAVFVENSRRAVECIKTNLAHTHLEENARVLPYDVMAAIGRLEREGSSFDLVFLDPPYRKGLERQVLERLAGSSLLKEDSLIVVESELDCDLSWLPDSGYAEVRRKEYKTNMHVFLQQEAL